MQTNQASVWRAFREFRGDMILVRYRSLGVVMAIAAGVSLLTAACEAADSRGPRTVSNPAQLQAALKSAKAGAVISLAPGAYGDVVVKRIDGGGTVTIASARSDAKASLTSLVIDASANIAVKDLEVAYPPEPDPEPEAAPAPAPDDQDAADAPAKKKPKRHREAVVQVLNSQHVRLDGLVVHAAPTSELIGFGNGALIRASSDVTVTNSEFHNLANGLSHLDSDHVTIDRNLFHDIKTDAVHGGGSSFVTVTHNVFWNFFRAKKDHPDAIQFWTSNTKESAHDLTIAGNLIMRGAGTPMQGIFMGDESKGRLPFGNVTITDNAVVGSMYNGIALSQANNVQIKNNVVSGYEDMKSWILVKGAVDSSVEDNESTSFHLDGENSNLKSNRNRSISTPKVGDKAALRKWYAAHSGDLPALPPAAMAFVQ